MKTAVKITGRQDLAANAIEVKAEKIDIPGAYSYPAITTIKVKRENIDSDCTVVLKIKQHRQVKVLDCGKVGNLKIPSRTELKTFCHSNLEINVAVFIHDPDTRKILFSTKSPIKISLDDKKDSDESPIDFIFTNTSSSIWELDDLNIYNKPCVSLNEKIVERTKFTKQSIFWPSVLPSLMEDILTWIWDEGNWDEEGWIQDWKKIVLELKLHWHDDNTAPYDQKDERDDWIDEIRKAWERQFSSVLVDKVLSRYGDEDED